ALLGDKPGTELSGGEWQKIALSRLFMRDADLLILDEPTASLDAEGEAEIYKFFMDIVGRETCIVISHRLAITKFVDKIAVLEKGHIVEYGSHKDLLSIEGRYARLFNLQSKQYAL
ncbi:MAG: ATP-binding cassette domain-containing protein, partial [Anaerolineales bacterium]